MYKVTYEGETRRYLTPFSFCPVAFGSMTEDSELFVCRPFLWLLLLDFGTGGSTALEEDPRFDFPSLRSALLLSCRLIGLFSVSCLCLVDLPVDVRSFFSDLCTFSERSAISFLTGFSGGESGSLTFSVLLSDNLKKINRKISNGKHMKVGNA